MQLPGLRLEAPTVISDSVPKLTVESVGNHVYFYSDIDSDRGLALVRQIRQLDEGLRNESLSRGMGKCFESARPPIWLHIQSPGGSLFAAFAIADQLKLVQTPIYSVVEGFAASAGTILSCCCQRRYIMPRAFMMIHQLSSVAWGKYEEIKDEAHMLDMAMDLIVEFYREHTKMKASQIKNLLKHDSWFKAEECLGLGLADAILE